MKKIYIIISFILLVSILGNLNYSVYAIEDNKFAIEIESDYYEEIGPILGYFGHNKSDKIYCSQLLDVTSETEDVKAMIIFEENEVIGIITGTYTNNEVLYSFIYSDFNELTNEIKDGKKIELVQVEDVLLSISEENINILVGEKAKNEKLRCNNKNKKKISKSYVTKKLSFEVTEKYEIVENNSK